MKDEEYLFHTDCRDKKIVARSARSKRTHNGKRGRVKLPSDYMTKKELNAMNGEVKSYRLNEPMSWKEFKAMPDDIKVTYIKLLREKYGVSDTNIGKMLGVSQNGIASHLRKLGISSPKGSYGKNFDKEGWLAWCNGVPVAKEEVTEEEPIAEEPVEEEIPVEIPVEIPAPVEARAIPDVGNMVFEGYTEEILKTVGVLLGGAKVHISITWDVVE